LERPLVAISASRTYTYGTQRRLQQPLLLPTTRAERKDGGSIGGAFGGRHGRLLRDSTIRRHWDYLRAMYRRLVLSPVAVQRAGKGESRRFRRRRGERARRRWARRALARERANQAGPPAGSPSSSQLQVRRSRWVFSHTELGRWGQRAEAQQRRARRRRSAGSTGGCGGEGQGDHGS
jgi:hypothetical protein